jgi:Zn-finger nucleic acid-binding protein
MKCPACDRELVAIQVGSVAVDVCQGGCGGVWFDAFELKKVDEEHEAAGEHLLQIGRDPNLKLDPTRKRECPRCAGIKLKRHLFSRTSQVEVDHCPNCAGYWLDHGELGKIREEQHPNVLAAKAKPQITMATIRYMYRLRIEHRPSA